MRQLLVIAIATVASLPACTCGPTQPPDTECVRNTDCSRGRVCTDGLCVDPVTGGGAAAGGTAAAGGVAMGGGAGGGVAAGGSAAGGLGGGVAGGSTAGGPGGGVAGGGVGGGTAGGSAGGVGGGTSDGGSTTDGGTDAGVCACSDLEECVSGLVCVPRYALLQWRSPANNATFDVGASVPLEAALLVAAGRTRNDPATLPFQASGDGGAVTGLLTRVDAGLFATSMTFGPGTWSAFVSLADAGLVDGPLVFSVRSLDFTLSWAPPPLRTGPPGTQVNDPLDDGSYFRRDEQTTVTVRNPSSASGVTVSVLGVALDGGAAELTLPAAASCTTCAGQPGFCACYALDLAAPPLDAFRGRFGFLVAGQVAGQSVTQSSVTHPARIPTLPVTRWKWALTGPLDAGPAAVEYAVLDPLGNLLAGFTQLDGGALDYGISSLSPQGATNWVSRVANATTDLAIVVRDAGEPTVFFGSQGRGFVALGATTGDGGVVCAPPANAILTGGLALVSSPLLGADLPVAVSSVPAMPATTAVVAAFPTGGSMCASQASAMLGTSALAANQGTLFVASNATSQIRSWSPLFGFGANVAYPGVTSVAQLIALPMTNFAGAGSACFTAGTTPSTIPATGAGNGALSTSAYWVPVTGASGLELVEVPFSGTMLSPPMRPPLPLQGTRATVALGPGGAVFAATDTGQLVAVRGGREVWSIPSDARLAGRFSPLLLDCARDVSGAKLAGRPGVAYLVGAPLRVQAIITDSAGLDVTQPWPMHRHDPRGTNNLSTPLTDFACP